MELYTVENLTTDSNGYIVFNKTIRLDVSDIEEVERFPVTELTEHNFRLVSLAIWNLEDYADLLIVYNNWNNPFWLPKGTILRVPNLQDIQAKIIVYEQHNKEISTSDIVQVNTLTAKDQRSSNVQRSDGRLIYTKTN